MNKSKNFSGQPIIKQLLKLISPDIITGSASQYNSDRYYKRFKTYDHLVTMLYATLSGVSSLRELSTILLACEGRIGHLNLKHFPKRSTLSDATSDAVLKDERICVQKKEKIIELRRIDYWDSEKEKVVEFITNNFELEPDKIADIYKYRWQIETMFKRLKQKFLLKYFLGDNQNAIEIQIWCGLIIQLLMLVIQRKTKRKWAYSNMVSMVRFHLMTYIDLFKFLENPNKQWLELTTKPPDKQLSKHLAIENTENGTLFMGFDCYF